MTRILFFPLITVPLLIALIIVKGFALYRAARRGEVLWFIVLLFVQTLGILELIYLFIITKGDSCCDKPHHHKEGNCCHDREN